MLFSKETLRSYASSKGISNIDDDALRILSQDLEYRIKELCQEASKFMLASHRTKLSITDVNYALISRNVEPLFGYDSQETLVFRGLPCNIYYVPDEEIDLEEYLEKPIPKIPLKPYIQSHWLAIEGVQPPIHQNPVLLEKPTIKQDTLSSYQEELELKQQYKHLLTKELSMYYDKILQTMQTEPSIAIECLSNESGIQQLVPYFIHHFKLEIKNNFQNESAVETILLMYFALLKNTYIFVDPYLHEILPTILSCIVNEETHENIIKIASDIIKHIFDIFGAKYKTLSPRIINFLKNNWLNFKVSEISQYGSIYCLSNLSEQIISDYIAPHISGYSPPSERIKLILHKISENK